MQEKDAVYISPPDSAQSKSASIHTKSLKCQEYTRNIYVYALTKLCLLLLHSKRQLFRLPKHRTGRKSPRSLMLPHKPIITQIRNEERKRRPIRRIRIVDAAEPKRNNTMLSPLAQPLPPTKGCCNRRLTRSNVPFNAPAEISFSISVQAFFSFSPPYLSSANKVGISSLKCVTKSFVKPSNNPLKVALSHSATLQP